MSQRKWSLYSATEFDSREQSEINGILFSTGHLSQSLLIWGSMCNRRGLVSVGGVW